MCLRNFPSQLVSHAPIDGPACAAESYLTTPQPGHEWARAIAIPCAAPLTCYLPHALLVPQVERHTRPEVEDK
jgi:hypothetical protein